MEDYYECLHHRKEVRQNITMSNLAALADPDFFHRRLLESRRCRPHTDRPRPRSCKRTPRALAKYGIWDC